MDKTTKKKTVAERKYSMAKRKEYIELFNKGRKFISDAALRKQQTLLNIKAFIKYVREMDVNSAAYLPLLPESVRKGILDKVSFSSTVAFKSRYMRMIKELWNEALTLGQKHMVTDILFATGLFDKELTNVSNFSSLDNMTLVEMLDTNKIAKFTSDRDNLTPEEKLAIARARRTLTILRNNVMTLKAQGVFPESYNMQLFTAKEARYSVEQKLSFLEVIQEIDNLQRKAEVSKKTFLTDEYLQRRYRVLTSDFADAYDNRIKKELGNYLDKNIEGLRQIINKNNDVNILAENIRNELRKSEEFRVWEGVETKTHRIIRTELALAYNFGKLSGFTSPEDLDREVRWNADWEAEYLDTNYDICDPCSMMDGRVFKIRDLIAVGTKLDRGILNYKGYRRTDFKNPLLPMIPFHVNCGCYWTVVSKEDTGTAASTTYVTTKTTSDVLAPIPSLVQAPVDTSNEGILNATIGTGLLVGSVFLLSRSNVWKVFAKSLSETAEKVVDESLTSSPVETVVNTSRYINVLLKGTAVEKKYTDVLIDTIETAPSTLPDVIKPTTPTVQPVTPSVPSTATPVVTTSGASSSTVTPGSVTIGGGNVSNSPNEPIAVP